MELGALPADPRLATKAPRGATGRTWWHPERSSGEAGQFKLIGTRPAAAEADRSPRSSMSARVNMSITRSEYFISDLPWHINNGHRGKSEMCRFCCKSRFAQGVKNSAGRRRGFRVKVRGTSSPYVKLRRNLGKATAATRIGGCFSPPVFAKNWSSHTRKSGHQDGRLGFRPRIRSAARSAIMITAALMLPPTRSGITAASTTRSPAVPCTRRA